MTDDLNNKKCESCHPANSSGQDGVVAGLNNEVADEYLKEIPDWRIDEEGRLKRRFEFKNFTEALVFVDKVGELAETEGHHPDISFGWGYAEITLFTHSIEALSKNDFIMAKKISDVI